MASITKGEIGEQDLHRWDGTATKTFTRTTSTGATLTLNKVGHEVDALITYGGGVNYTRGTIVAAMAAIGVTNKVTLVLRPGTWVISADLDMSTYPNITVKAVPGTIIQIDTGITLTTGGPFEAGLYRVFSCVGTGKVVFGESSAIREVYPEWWATNVPGTTDMAAAFTSANSSLGSTRTGIIIGGTIKLGATRYRLASGVVFSEHVSLKGSGVNATRINAAEAISPFTWTNASGSAATDVVGNGIQDMTISTDCTSGAPIGITVTDMYKFYIKRIKFIDLPDTCIKVQGSSYETDISECRIMNFKTAGISLVTSGGDYPNTSVIYNNDFGGKDGSTSISITAGSNYTIHSNHFEYAGTDGGTHIDLNGAIKGTKIHSNVIGANYTATGTQIKVRGGATMTVISGNRISVTGAGDGIMISGAGSDYTNIANNIFEIDQADMVIEVNDRYNVNITGNNFKLVDSGTEGCTAVINLTGAAYFVNVIGNIIYGEGAGDMPGDGINVDSSCIWVNIANNQIVNMTVGIDINTNASALRAIITGNQVYGCGTSAAITNYADVYLRDNVGIDNSIPKEEGLLSTTTVTLAADGEQTIYTVPIGVRCILTKAVLIVGADAGSTDFTIGQDTAETDFLGTQQCDNLNAANDVGIFMPVPAAVAALQKSYAGGTVIKFTVANQAGGATNTLKLYGIIY